MQGVAASDGFVRGGAAFGGFARGVAAFNCIVQTASGADTTAGAAVPNCFVHGVSFG